MPVDAFLAAGITEFIVFSPELEAIVLGAFDVCRQSSRILLQSMDPTAVEIFLSALE